MSNAIHLFLYISVEAEIEKGGPLAVQMHCTIFDYEQGGHIDRVDVNQIPAHMKRNLFS